MKRVDEIRGGTEAGKPAENLANTVYEKLKKGESLGNVTDLNALAEQHFGSARTSGTWSLDALRQLGVQTEGFGDPMEYEESVAPWNQQVALKTP